MEVKFTPIPKIPGEPGKADCCFYGGTLHKDKGVHTLLSAVALALKNGVNARVLLVEGSEAASLSCQIEELGEKSFTL